MCVICCFSYALSRIVDSGKLIILEDKALGIFNDNVIANDKEVWLTRSLVITPQRFKERKSTRMYSRLNLNLVITHLDYDDEVKVQFQYLLLTGILYVGDADVIITNCIVQDLRIKPALYLNADSPPEITYMNLHFIHSNMSDISLDISHNDTSYITIAYCILEINNCELTNYNILMDTRSSDIIIADSTFNGESESSFKVHLTSHGKINPAYERCYTSDDGETDYYKTYFPHSENSLIITNSQFSDGDIGLEVLVTAHSRMEAKIINSAFTKFNKGFEALTEDTSYISTLISNTNYSYVTNSGHGGAFSLLANTLLSTVKILNCTFRENSAVTLSRNTTHTMKKDEPGRGGAIAVGTTSIGKSNSNTHIFNFLHTTLKRRLS